MTGAIHTVTEARPGALLRNLTTFDLAYMVGRSDRGLIEVSTTPGGRVYARWEPTDVALIGHQEPLTDA